MSTFLFVELNKNNERSLIKVIIVLRDTGHIGDSIRSRHCCCFESSAGQLTFTDADCWLVRSQECPRDCCCHSPLSLLFICPAPLYFFSAYQYTFISYWDVYRDLWPRWWRKIFLIFKCIVRNCIMWNCYPSVHIDAQLASHWLHLTGLRHWPDAIGSMIFFFITVTTMTSALVVIIHLSIVLLVVDLLAIVSLHLSDQ